MNQRYFSHIIGSEVVLKDDGQELGKVIDAIVDPSTGKLEGLWVKTGGGFRVKKVLLTKDITDWKLKIYVEDAEVLSDPAEIVRITRILEQETYVYEQKVETLDKVYIGKVYDYSFDVISFTIVNIYTLKRFLWLPYDRRIINSSDIVEITPDSILVRNDLRSVKWRKKKLIDVEDLVIQGVE